MSSKHIVRSMGSGLLPALVNEVQRKDQSSANCQAILNHLVQVKLCLFKYGIKHYCTMMTIRFYCRSAV